MTDRRPPSVRSEAAARLTSLIRALVVCALALWALPVPAQRNESGPGGGWLSDPGSIETVSGEVVRVEKVSHAGAGRAMYLVLRTDTGEVFPIALGPEWVVERHALRIHAGDRIEVTGWCIVRGKSALLAATVKKGDESLLLRDWHGIPVWSRGGGRRAR